MDALFEDVDHMTRSHVQFSSRRTPEDILAAVEAAAQELGGSAQRRGERRSLLSLPAGGGRALRLQVHLFEVLAGVHVCQIDKDAGGLRIVQSQAEVRRWLLAPVEAVPFACHLLL
jgi:hypothetical protein